MLVVTRPFGHHAPGDQITDPGLIRDIVSGAHLHDVVRVIVPHAVSDEREET